MSRIDYEEESAKRGNWLDITGGAAKDSLTVLDYFAAKAMAELIGTGFLPSEVADEAYDYAEAMLEERTKRVTPTNVVRGVTGNTYG